MRRLVALFLAFSLVFVLVLSPYFTNGYWNDDCLNSTVPGWLLNRGAGFSALLKDSWQNWSSSGRVFPLSPILVYGAYNLIPSLELFRIYQMILVLLNIIFFVRLIRNLGGSKAISGLTVVFLFLCFQVRQYHDPIAAYGAMLQWLFLFLLMALDFYHRALMTDSFRRWWLMGAAFCYAASLLVYEVSFGFLILFPIIWTEQVSQRVRWRSLLPLLLVWELAFLTNVALRLQAVHAYEGTQSGLLSKVPMVTLKQLSGVIPFLYYGRHVTDHDWGLLIREALAQPLSWILMGALSCVLWSLLADQTGHLKERKTGRLWGLACFLLIVPSGMIALSARYQREIDWGRSYLPIYISYFGASLVYSLLISKALGTLRSRSDRRAVLVLGFCCILISFGIVLNRTLNQWVAFKINKIYLYPRQFVESAAAAGLFDDLRSNDLVLTPDDQWMVPDFMATTKAQASGFRLQPLDHWRSVPHSGTSEGRTFLLQYDVADLDFQVMTLSQIPSGFESNLLRADCGVRAQGYRRFVSGHRALEAFHLQSASFPIEQNRLRWFYEPSLRKLRGGVEIQPKAITVPCP